MKTNAKSRTADLMETFFQARAHQKDKRVQRLARKENDRRRRHEMQMLKSNKAMEDAAWA